MKKQQQQQRKSHAAASAAAAAAATAATIEADKIVAATAGLDNWKTWSGRKHGSNHFQFSDLLHGTKRTFQKTFLWTIPPPGSTCPICFGSEELESTSISNNNNSSDNDPNPNPSGTQEFWHITSSCGHAICIDCLQQYATSQVRDTEHIGPLKCPVCALPLRRSDAIVALGTGRSNNNNDHRSSIVQEWDTKIRDQFLRALPSFRHCPKCCNNNINTNTNSDTNTTQQHHYPSSSSSLQFLAGGGFVTPECLTPQYEVREEAAEQVLSYLRFIVLILLALYITYVLSYDQWQHTTTTTTTTIVDLINLIPIPIYVLWRVSRYMIRYIAHEARQALSKPITVICPCCEESFILNAESELLSSTSSSSPLADKQTQEWIGTNTRPCPSCSVPISKESGCNHMRCTHCRANFCWACMRIRTHCGAYGCHNGAPFGNSLPPSPRTRGGGGGGGGNNPNNNLNNALDLMIGGRGGRLSLVDRITRLEAISRNSNTIIIPNNTTNGNNNTNGNENNNNNRDNHDDDNDVAILRQDVSILVVLVLFVVTPGIRDSYPIQVLSTILTTLFVIVFSSSTLLLMVSIWMIIMTWNDLQQRRPQQRPPPQQLRRMEEEMLAEALQRSRLEQ